MRLLVILFCCFICQLSAASAVTPVQFRDALTRASKGQTVDNSALRNSPLWAYVEYAALTRDVKKQEAAPVVAFVARTSPSSLADRIRSLFVPEFARRKDQASLLAIADPTSSVLDQRCMAFVAQQRLTPDSAEMQTEGLAIFDGLAGETGACMAVTGWLRDRGLLDEARVRARIDRAMATKAYSSAALFAKDLPSAQGQLLLRRVGLAQGPTAALKDIANWPDDAGHRAIVEEAVARLGASNPSAAQAIITRAQTKLKFPPLQHDRMRGQVARGLLINDDPAGAALAASLKPSAVDRNAREWWARHTLRRGQLEKTLSIVQGIDDLATGEMRWRYTHARLTELVDSLEAAKADYAAIATDNGFHGFLAADRLSAPYAICPEEESVPPALAIEVLAIPAIGRAMALLTLDQPDLARREWVWATTRITPEQRRAAGILIAKAGHGELAILTLNQPRDWPLLVSRYPLLHSKTLTRYANKVELDSAWAAGLIRAESAWNPKARSHANAQGLMQLLPSTAAIEAKALGLKGPLGNLYAPQYNLRLGTYHLSKLNDRFGGDIARATAGYNAGPNAVKRWNWPGVTLSPDLWAETITYRETRDYVPRVLGFSVIYDWRIDGTVTRLSNRLLGMPRVDVPATLACPSAKNP